MVPLVAGSCGTVIVVVYQRRGSDAGHGDVRHPLGSRWSGHPLAFRRESPGCDDFNRSPAGTASWFIAAAGAAGQPGAAQRLGHRAAVVAAGAFLAAAAGLRRWL